MSWLSRRTQLPTGAAGSSQSAHVTDVDGRGDQLALNVRDQGSGIGLAVMQAMVQRMGGWALVAHAPGC